MRGCGNVVRACLNKRNLIPWIIISGIFAVLIVAITITTIVSFIRNPIFTEPPSQLINQGYVHIESSGTHQIFIEDRQPPTLNSHQFIFTNVEDQSQIYSDVPRSASTYSIGAVSINNEYVRGRFGRRVATVDLEPGVYIVEFLPYEGTGDFVWGSNVLGAALQFTLIIVVAVIAFLFCLTVFIILLEKHLRLKRNGKMFSRRLQG